MTMWLSEVWATPGAMLVSNGHAAAAGPALPPGAMVTSRPSSLLRAMSGSMVLLQLGVSVLKFEVSVATKGHMGLGCFLWPCSCLRVDLPPEPNRSKWPALVPEVMMSSRSKLLQGVMSGHCSESCPPTLRRDSHTLTMGVGELA